MVIDIIGAGIGGLTTAIALNQKGISTRIFEQTKKIKPVGAGIILANNAMQVYEKLGLRKEIEEQGNSISSMSITKANLSPLSKVDLSFFEKKYQVKNIAIHRAALQQILLNNLPKNTIYLNHHLTKIESNNLGNVLTFANGIKTQSSVLIGADGLQSVVRQNLFPDYKLRNAKQICWRGITTYTLPHKYRHELNEAWGENSRFGFVQIAKNKVYWYALKSFKHDKNEFAKQHIETYFEAYSPVIKDIIFATDKEQLHTAEIADLPPIHTWYQENTCLIGDAAHAMTPNMGQGACQAIEDAYILSNYLDTYEVHTAFKEFQRVRLPKAHQVVKASWILGKIAHASHPIVRGIRNQLLRITPSSFSQKQSEQLFQLPSL